MCVECGRCFQSGICETIIVCTAQWKWLLTDCTCVCQVTNLTLCMEARSMGILLMTFCLLRKNLVFFQVHIVKHFLMFLLYLHFKNMTYCYCFECFFSLNASLLKSVSFYFNFSWSLKMLFYFYLYL